jgi:hypothetical protein
MRLSMRSLVVLLVVLAAGGLTMAQDKPSKTEAAPDGFDLRPQYKKGSTSRYRLTQITEQRMEILGEKRHTISTSRHPRRVPLR